VSTAIDIYRGDDATATITLVENGSAMDLTAAVVRMTFKRSVFETDEDAFLRKTSETDGGIEIDADPTSGRITVAFVPEDTEDLVLPERFRYDVQVERGDTVRTIMTGRLGVRLDVTRTTS
jgi:hypothetical protein